MQQKKQKQKQLEQSEKQALYLQDTGELYDVLILNLSVCNLSMHVDIYNSPPDLSAHSYTFPF